MQKCYLVSAIVPVYNSEKFISKCLSSLNNQSLDKKKFEVIVVDDYSIDSSCRIINKYKNKQITLIKNKKNIGLAASLNRGITVSKGSFVVRVDSDDWVHEDFLYILSKFLLNKKNIDAVACDYTLTNEKEVSISVKNCLKKPIGCGIMFRKKQLLDIGLYDRSFKYAEEEALRKKFLKKYDIIRIPLSLYNYRQHSKNRSKNKIIVKYYQKKLSNE